MLLYQNFLINNKVDGIIIIYLHILLTTNEREIHSHKKKRYHFILFKKTAPSEMFAAHNPHFRALSLLFHVIIIIGKIIVQIHTQNKVTSQPIKFIASKIWISV